MFGISAANCIPQLRSGCSGPRFRHQRIHQMLSSHDARQLTSHPNGGRASLQQLKCFEPSLTTGSNRGIEADDLPQVMTKTPETYQGPIIYRLLQPDLWISHDMIGFHPHFPRKTGHFFSQGTSACNFM